MRSPKAGNRTPGAHLDPAGIDVEGMDPFQSLILQQMHLMQKAQAEMFQKVFETQTHVQDDLSHLHSKVHSLEKQNSVSSAGVPVGDQYGTKDTNTMTAKNKNPSPNANKVSTHGLQTLVREQRISEAYNQLTTHLLSPNSKQITRLDELLKKFNSDDDSTLMDQTDELVILIRLMGKTGVCTSVIDD